MIRKYCDRAVLIDGGKIAFDGTADVAVEKYLDLFDTKRSLASKETKKKVEGVDKKVIIKGVKSTCSPAQITVDVELQSSVDQDNLKLALRMLDKNNKVVAGINTQSVLNPVIIDLAAKQTKRVRLSMPNILGNGEFSVDVRVGPMVYTGTIHDKVSGVAEFKNSKDEVYYPVALPARVEVKVK